MNVDRLKPAIAAALLVMLAGCGGGDPQTIASLAPLSPAAIGPQAADYPGGADMPPPPPGPARYDTVGYAAVIAEGGLSPAISATHAALPIGRFIELTALDSGKTIIVIITDGVRPRHGWLLNLSSGAAQALGGGAAGALTVRVRRIDPPGIDQAALRDGRPATERIDAPPVLLRALRKRLPSPPRGIALDEPSRPAPPARATRPGVGAPYPEPGRAAAIRASLSGIFVQIAALSSPERASALAQSVGGTVQAGNGVYRVRLGPYADAKSAERARAEIAQRGYGDARIVRD